MVNGGIVPDRFYEPHCENGQVHLTLTDHFLRLAESPQFAALPQEAEARWRLVETAWNLNIRANLLEVEYEAGQESFFVQRDLLRRVDVTSVRDALNGYQQGKCFYTFRDLSIAPGAPDLCAVDHFLPHVNKAAHLPASLDGVWNLVLADRATNGAKSAKVPVLRYLERLHRRNEFFIASQHPLAETIVRQTGATPALRSQFLQCHYQLALNASIHTWQPAVELPATY